MLQSPTNRCPSSPVSGGRGDGQADRNTRRRNVPSAAVPIPVSAQQANHNHNYNPKRGRSETREMSASGGGGGGGTLRDPQRTPIPGTAVPNPSLVTLIPTHTIDSAPEVVSAVAAARRRGPIASTSAAAFVSAVGGTRGRTRGAVGKSSAARNATSHPRPRTSTGYEKHVRSKMATEALAAKLGDRNARKEVGHSSC